MTTKRSIVIILALIGIGIAAYLLLRPEAPSGLVEKGQTGSLPSAVPAAVEAPSFFAPGAASGTPVGMVSIVDAGPVAAYFISTSSASAVTVVRTDGEIVSLAGGQASVLSSSSVGTLVSAGFSHDGAKIVMSTGMVTSPQVGIFDVAARSWSSLGMGLISAVWAPAGGRLAYLRDAGNGAESIMTTDFSKTKPSTAALGTFSLQDMRLSWIDANNLALVSRPSAYANGSALLFNVPKKTLTPIVADRPGFEATWGATASGSVELAFSSGQSERGGHLQLLNSQGGTLQNVSFLTLPTKCVFAALAEVAASAATSTAVSTGTARVATSAITNNNRPTTSLFCAVPRDQTTLSYYDLPDAYEQRQIFTTDDLYRVNIANGHIDVIFNDQTQDFDMANVSVVGTSLFFVNRYDARLYAIQIQ